VYKYVYINCVLTIVDFDIVICYTIGHMFKGRNISGTMRYLIQLNTEKIPYKNTQGMGSNYLLPTPWVLFYEAVPDFVGITDS